MRAMTSSEIEYVSGGNTASTVAALHTVSAIATAAAIGNAVIGDEPGAAAAEITALACDLVAALL